MKARHFATEAEREKTKQWDRRRQSKSRRRLRRRFARLLVSGLPLVSKQIHKVRYWNSKRKIVRPIERPTPIGPDFIIIGAPKCGTSWLRNALNQHPDVLTVRGEIEYFSSHPFYPKEWYFEHFARLLAANPNVDPASCILGEKSAHYCSLSRQDIARVQRLVPNARLILMTRDPVSRHWAHAKKHFAKAPLHEPETAVLDVPRAKLLEFFAKQRPVGEFSQIIQNWTSVIPAEQLLILSQEKTLQSPKASYDAALRHIGAMTDYDSSSITLLSQQKNRGPKVEMPPDVRQFLEDMYGPERQRVEDIYRDRSPSMSPEN